MAASHREWEDGMAAGGAVSAAAGWQDYDPHGWQDYKEPSVESPIPLPAIAKPHIDVEPESIRGFVNRVTGHPDYKPTPISTIAKRTALGIGKDFYNTSAPNLASQAVRHFTGKSIPYLPASSLEETLRSAQNIGLTMLTGEPEAEAAGATGEASAASRFPAVTQEVGPRELWGLPRGGQAEALKTIPARTPTPSAALSNIPVPSDIPRLRPINVREPGEIPPTMIRPRAVSPYAPVEPIPARPGLQLRGEVAPAEVPAMAGSAEGAARDTALFQQARQELGPQASIGQIAQRAQQLKTGSTPEVTPPSAGWYPPRATVQWPPVESGADDLGESRFIQENIRDQAAGELNGLRRIGNEEAYFRNTRQPTPKSVLNGNIKPVKYTATHGVKASGSKYPAVDSGSEEDLTPTLRESLKIAMRKKTRN